MNLRTHAHPIFFFLSYECFAKSEALRVASLELIQSDICAQMLNQYII